MGSGNSRSSGDSIRFLLLVGGWVLSGKGGLLKWVCCRLLRLAEMLDSLGDSDDSDDSDASASSMSSSLLSTPTLFSAFLKSALDTPTYPSCSSPYLNKWA